MSWKNKNFETGRDLVLYAKSKITGKSIELSSNFDPDNLYASLTDEAVSYLYGTIGQTDDADEYELSVGEI